MVGSGPAVEISEATNITTMIQRECYSQSVNGHSINPDWIERDLIYIVYIKRKFAETKRIQKKAKHGPYMLYLDNID